MMYRGKQNEYLAQMEIKSRRAENAFQLTKVECFPGIEPPQDGMIEAPLTTMPLFGFMCRGNTWLSYEDQVCSFYKKYQKKHRKREQVM